MSCSFRELGARFAALVMACVTGVAAQERAQSFAGSSAELVVLPVTVTDQRGAFVGDLPGDRFAVFDNGRRQALAFFTGDDVPVTLALAIDSSGSMAAKLADVVVATLTLARLSNPADEIFVVAFNDAVHDQTPSRPLAISNAGALASKLRSLAPEGRTALYDALTMSIERVEQGTRPRRAVVVVSDGGDNASRTTLEAVLARARRSNVTIFTIGVFDEDDPDKNPGILKSLAQSTGGERFLPQSPGRLVQVCERIARELRHGYTLGYVPPDRDGTYHRVRVEVAPVAESRLTVRTRPGYFAAAAPR